MGKLIIVGIDGMDADFVAEHIDELPNFRALRDRGYGGPARSVFPTDSIPAWITIFTGIPPVQHGVLDAIDYFKKDHKDFAVDTSAFQGRTFWDVASENGRRSCIVNPFMAYPPWDIEGIMASGPVFVEGGTPAVTPASIAGELRMPEMGGIVDFPTRETMAQFCRETRDYTSAQHEFSLGLLDDRGPWDIFFSTYLTLDRVKHFLWRYHDEDDPTYPGETPLKGEILSFYHLFDRVVGDYLERCDDDTGLLVVSDHGHGRRCTQVVNVNEILRREGYLKTRADGTGALHPRKVLQKLKRSAMEFLDRHDLTDMTYRVAKLVPKARELKKAGFLVNEGDNAAWTPYFAGTNPCGGVSISAERAAEHNTDYEGLRRDVIGLLRSQVDPATGKPLFKWVLPREEFLGTGESIDRYPDILFLMESGYGTGWDLFGDVVAVNATHRKISGGHKVDGILYTSFGLPGGGSGPGGQYALEDIAPLVLDRLGLPARDWMVAGARSARPA